MPPTTPTSKTNWSKFQQDIFRDVKEGCGHSIVLARSGSGKTSTLLEALKYVPSSKSILLVAFNKRVAVELQERAPQYSNLDISTLHSFGYRVIREASNKKIKLDPDKTFKIAKSILEPDKPSSKAPDNYEAIYEIQRAVNLCKNQIVDTPSKIDALLDEFNIQTVGYDRDDFIQRIIQTLGECKKQDTTVDYGDLVWYPFIFNLPIPQYDRVCIDEKQDLSRSQEFLALGACKKDGRILACADDFQILYSWAGVDLDNVEALQKKLKAKVLPLPVSYRCAKSIIYEAQKIVPDITFRPDAPEGEVIRIEEEQVLDLIRPGDMLISRTNAELIKFCFALWKKKIPANIKGKDLGVGLSAIIKQSKKKNVASFLEWLDAWEKEELSRLKEKKRSTALISDKLECLRVLCQGKETLEEVKQTLKELFDDKDKGNIVALGTIHFFKGAESKRVFFLLNTMRFGNGKGELNAKYVAITRAKEQLYLVE